MKPPRPGPAAGAQPDRRTPQPPPEVCAAPGAAGRATTSWNLDGTVIAPAAPHIAAELRIPAVGVNVAITAYVSPWRC